MTQTSLVSRVQAAKGNALAADALIRDYLPFIKAAASKALGRIITGSCDELSIAMLAFHEAVESYQRLRGAFLKYASVVIKHRLIDYYRREQRHAGQLLHKAAEGEGEEAADPWNNVPDSTDAYAESDLCTATKQEIAELSAELAGFGLSLSDVADDCPQQERTLRRCQQALAYAREYPEVIAELKRTKKLPLTRLTEGSGVERKTLERHRKYLMALMLIYSNGYEIIRGHLKQVLKPRAESAGGVNT